MGSARPRSARPLRRRRAAAAAIAIVLLVLMQVMVFGAVSSGARDQDLLAQRIASARVLYAAEGVTNMALRELMTGVDGDGDGTVGSISDDGNPANDPLIGGGRASATLTTSGSSRTITVRAAAGAARRGITVNARINTSSGTAPGLAAQYWSRASSAALLSQVDWSATPTATGRVPDVAFANATDTTAPMWRAGATGNWAARFTGKLNIPTAGAWTLSTESDDGSSLTIDNVLVVNNDTAHSLRLISGVAVLTAGQHDLDLKFFENGGSHGLNLYWSGPGVPSRVLIPPSALSGGTVTAPGLVAHTSASLTGGGANSLVVDCYNASAGAYSSGGTLSGQTALAANTASAGGISISGGAQVAGNVQFVTPASGVTVVSLASGGTITGSQSSSAIRNGLERISLPQSMPASSGALTVNGSSTLTLSSNMQVSTLTLMNNAVVTVTGNVTLQVNGNATIQNNAQLVIQSGASLRLFITGTLSVINNAIVNDASARPGGFEINMTGSAQSITFSNNAVVGANIRNPLGSFTIGDGVVFYGTAEVNTLAASGSAKLHIDVSAGAGSSGSGGGGLLNSLTRAATMLNWTEGP